ncbi:MAG TPA: DUF2007 domain-containing protein [Thermoanaerobaculia bacterium]|nr:DUF2007 domain-containing protein [Thermoanaerobaculia bacterium]
MPYCPQCKHHFDSPATECPDDRVKLVDELPFQTIDGDDGTWVEITSVGSEEEARLLAGFLDAEGIPAEVESLKFSMEPVNLGSMSEIRVYVAAEHEERAMQLLDERRGEFERLRNDEDVVTDDGATDINAEAEAAAGREEP